MSISMLYLSITHLPSNSFDLACLHKEKWWKLRLQRWQSEVLMRLPCRDCTDQATSLTVSSVQEIFCLLDGQNRTRLKSASWCLCLSAPPECPHLLRRQITRTTINPLNFSCTLSDYLSHNLVPVQRHNSDLGFVRRHCWSVGYFGC